MLFLKQLAYFEYLRDSSKEYAEDTYIPTYIALIQEPWIWSRHIRRLNISGKLFIGPTEENARTCIRSIKDVLLRGLSYCDCIGRYPIGNWSSIVGRENSSWSSVAMPKHTTMRGEGSTSMRGGRLRWVTSQAPRWALPIKKTFIAASVWPYLDINGHHTWMKFRKNHLCRTIGGEPSRLRQWDWVWSLGDDPRILIGRLSEKSSWTLTSKRDTGSRVDENGLLSRPIRPCLEKKKAWKAKNEKWQES